MLMTTPKVPYRKPEPVDSLDHRPVDERIAEINSTASYAAFFTENGRTWQQYAFTSGTVAIHMLRHSSTPSMLWFEVLDQW